MRFAFGFGTVTPLLLLKDLGKDSLGHESPTDACSPTPSTCAIRRFGSQLLGNVVEK